MSVTHTHTNPLATQEGRDKKEKHKETSKRIESGTLTLKDQAIVGEKGRSIVVSYPKPGWGVVVQ